MKNNIFGVLFITAGLFVGYLCAQESPQSNQLSIRVTAMAGQGSVDRWKPFRPIRNLFDNMEWQEYSTIYQIGLGTNYSFSNKWAILADVSYQHSQCSKTSSYSSVQQYWQFGVQGEYKLPRFYIDAGLFLAYETEANSLIHYPPFAVRASNFNGGPQLGAGFILPVAKKITMRLGTQITFGLLRYYNYYEQYNTAPEQRKYNHIYIMPTVLFSMQIEWKMRNRGGTNMLTPVT